MASHIAKNIIGKDDKFLNELAEFISATVHPMFTMVETIPERCVIYHHGKLCFM